MFVTRNCEILKKNDTFDKGQAKHYKTAMILGTAIRKYSKNNCIITNLLFFPKKNQSIYQIMSRSLTNS